MPDQTATVRRYFYDFEFIDDGRTIDPISIGVVHENGDGYYAVFAETDMGRVKAHPWLARNVLPHLPLNNRGAVAKYLATEGHARADLLGPVDLDRTDDLVRPRWRIAQEVRAILLDDLPEGHTLELVGDYCAYDHVALAQLYGPMVELPDGFPMFTRDIQDYARHLGVEDAYLPQQDAGAAHDAHADALNIRERWRFLRGIEYSRARATKLA
jgi:hypothetical protein